MVGAAANGLGALANGGDAYAVRVTTAVPADVVIAKPGLSMGDTAAQPRVAYGRPGAATSTTALQTMTVRSSEALALGEGCPGHDNL